MRPPPPTGCFGAWACKDAERHGCIGDQGARTEWAVVGRERIWSPHRVPFPAASDAVGTSLAHIGAWWTVVGRERKCAVRTAFPSAAPHRIIRADVLILQSTVEQQQGHDKRYLQSEYFVMHSSCTYCALWFCVSCEGVRETILTVSVTVCEPERPMSCVQCVTGCERERYVLRCPYWNSLIEAAQLRSSCLSLFRVCLQTRVHGKSQAPATARHLTLSLSLSLRDRRAHSVSDTLITQQPAARRLHVSSECTDITYRMRNYTRLPRQRDAFPRVPHMALSSDLIRPPSGAAGASAAPCAPSGRTAASAGPRHWRGAAPAAPGCGRGPPRRRRP